MQSIMGASTGAELEAALHHGPSLILTPGMVLTTVCVYKLRDTPLGLP